MSMYEPYIELINKYITDGYNLKEIHKKLEENGVYGTYNTFYDFCKRHGIIAKAGRICKNCQNCDKYYDMENGYEVRVCNAEKAVIKAKYVPRWCDGRFKELKDRRTNI